MNMKTMFLLAAAALTLAGCDKAGAGAAGTATPAAGATPIKAVAAPAGTDWTTTVVQTPEGGFRMGNPDAKIKLVEFASMTCVHCKNFSAQSADVLKNQYVKSGQVSFEFRNFVTNQIDVVQSLLARCGGTGPFFTLTEQMFAEQDATLAKVQAGAAEMQAAEALPGAQTFVRVAEIAGLDKFVGMRGIPAAKAQACLTDKVELDKLVAMNQAAVKDYKSPATPSILFNGKLLEAPPVGEEVWPNLEPQIKAALAA